MPLYFAGDITALDFVTLECKRIKYVAKSVEVYAAALSNMLPSIALVTSYL